MDYIERERRRLEIDLYALSRRWHGTLSRMFVLRDRLDGIDPTDVEAFSRTANTLGAFANDATSLKRDVDKAKRRLASFDVDAQRRANADVDGSCRYLTINGRRWKAPAGAAATSASGRTTWRSISSGNGAPCMSSTDRTAILRAARMCCGWAFRNFTRRSTSPAGSWRRATKPTTCVRPPKSNVGRHCRRV